MRIGEWAEIQRGVRQGCVLSPNLFSIYSQAVTDEIVDIEGLRIGGINTKIILLGMQMIPS